MLIKEKIITKKLMDYRNQKWNMVSAEAPSENSAVKLHGDNIASSLHVLKVNQVNTSIRDIEIGSGIKGRIYWLIKKVIRRLGLFYVQPVCDQQTVYNTASVQCIENLLMMGIHLNNKIENLQKENENMQKTIRQMHTLLTEDLADTNIKLEDCMIKMKAVTEQKNIGA